MIKPNRNASDGIGDLARRAHLLAIAEDATEAAAGLLQIAAGALAELRVADVRRVE